LRAAAHHTDGPQSTQQQDAATLAADPSRAFALTAGEFLVRVNGSSSGLYRGDTISFVTSLERTHTISGTQTDRNSNDIAYFRCTNCTHASAFNLLPAVCVGILWAPLTLPGS
jgi:hypothetical protein